MPFKESREFVRSAPQVPPQGFGDCLVPTQPWLFIVNKENIFTGIMTNSMRKLMMMARDRSLGTCLKWLSPLKERPPMANMSHSKGKLKASPNNVVTVPG